MKAKAFVYVWGTVLSVATLSGCDVVESSEVSSSTDYASYSARYDGQTHTAHYSAHFSVGGDLGTVLDLDGNSSVTIDGYSMQGERDILNDLYYVASEASVFDLQQTHEFVFVDQNGVTHGNDFVFPYPIAPVSGQSLNASFGYGFSVVWSAQGPSTFGGFPTATLTRSDGMSVSATGGSANGGVLTFSPGDIQQMAASELTLTLCYEVDTTNISGDAEGGTLQVSSCSPAYPVYVD